jgi:hypothetical protein
MAGGINIDSSTAGKVRDTFRQYVQFNKRDQDFLWQDQSRKLAVDLYTETAAIAPTRAEIAADVKALGWKIPTKFADGRLARGTAAMWLNNALIKNRRVARKRGRKSKKDFLTERQFLAQKPTLSQMQQFVINLRTKARLFLASGWLGASADLGGSLSDTSGAVQHDRGGATVFRSPGLVQVLFWNRTPGIATMQEKKDFVGKANGRRVADMWVYIRRKMGEGRALLRQAA